MVANGDRRVENEVAVHGGEKVVAANDELAVFGNEAATHGEKEVVANDE
jgi:hypothetical protein